MKLGLISILLFFAVSAQGHIGSPNVYFEGKADAFHVRIIIRPPGVVPGLAEVNVRLLEGHAERVTARPIYLAAGRAGAPRPDVAVPVRGETNLYDASLWLMKPGSYSVEVTVEGKRRGGKVLVPVDSVATVRYPMQRWFGTMLAALGALLLLGAIRLVGVAFNEAMLSPGTECSEELHRQARLAMGGGTLVFLIILLLGKLWWCIEDRDYSNNQLYKPMLVTARVKFEQTQPIVRLTVDENKTRKWTPLIADHGKLMHLFVVREPGADAFAHLHPAQKSPTIFDAALPPLPEGDYRMYADVTHEDGSSDTLMAPVHIPKFSESFVRFWQMSEDSEVMCSANWRLNVRTNLAQPPDPDDSWCTGKFITDDKLLSPGPPSRQRCCLANDYSMTWQGKGELRANRDACLTFTLQGAHGPAILEPYMGMLGHAVVMRRDGAVFAHLHPEGTFSMASRELFGEHKSKSNHINADPQHADNVDLGLDMANHSNHSVLDAVSRVSFPYEFPSPGSYRLWVQLKSKDRVFTGVFDAEVRSDK